MSGRLTRRQTLALGGALGLLTLTACAIERSEDSPRTTEPTDPDPGGVAALRTEPDDPRAAAFLAAQTHLAVSLLTAAHAEADEDNATISPLSVGQAMAMIAQGARGQTLAELTGVLGGSTAEDLAYGANAQISALADLTSATVSLANTAFLDDKLTLLDGFTKALSDYFAATPQGAPLSTDQEVSAEQINGWVAQRTEDQIPELITADLLNEESRLVLVNAIYLKARWASPFDPNDTQPGPFHAPGGEVSTDKMSSRRNLPYGSADGVQAVELAYEDEGLAAYVVLPDDGTLPGYLGALTGESLWALLDSLAQTEVDLELPKFEVRQALGLADTFKKLGMPTAFTADADFSALSNDPTFISFIQHEAWIKVAEKGTEAAAATAGGMEAGSAPMPSEPVDFDVDRPFLFFVCEKATRSVLFATVVNDPTLTAS